jgi:hypothetical protein
MILVQRERLFELGGDSVAQASEDYSEHHCLALHPEYEPLLMPPEGYLSARLKA